MTSFPVYKKTSISRKGCVIEQKLPLLANRKLGLISQNLSMKTMSSAPYRRNHHDVISGFQENHNISEMVFVREKTTLNP
jgi:hypothetical protein